MIHDNLRFFYRKGVLFTRGMPRVNNTEAACHHSALFVAEVV